MRNSKTTKKMPRCDSRINPRTERCVLRRGEVGRHLRGRPKTCRAVYNTVTGRCRVSRSSRSSPPRRKSSSSRSSRSSSRSRSRSRSRARSRNARRPKKTTTFTRIPGNLASLVKDAREVKRRWNKKECIGSGANGAVYRACKNRNSKDCEYVIKVQRWNMQARQELRAYKDLGKSRLVPRLHAAWKSGNNMYLVIDQLRPCRPKPRRKEVFDLLNKLERKGWMHVDTHDQNVMCTKNQKAVLIDFGWAVKKCDEPFFRHPSGCRYVEDLREAQEENVRDHFR